MAANPSEYRADLAHSLHWLGIDLSNLNRNDEALQVAREAVECYQTYVGEFADDRRDAQKTLAELLDKLGRPEEADQVRRDMTQ